MRDLRRRTNGYIVGPRMALAAAVVAVVLTLASVMVWGYIIAMAVR